MALEATKKRARKFRGWLANPRDRVFNRGAKGETESALRKHFDVYRADNLQIVGRTEFKRHVMSRLGTLDAEAEGYRDAELERQRDLSIKFHWGHNHDFGDFQIDGRMGDRHIDLMTDFVDFFPIALEDFRGKAVLDIGCWTGGTTLLLAALGSNVVALEEVKKYAETASFLARSFGLEDQVVVESASLYGCRGEAYHDRFDVAYFPGVIYHLSDPVLGLRILFNALKPGGILLVESAGINNAKPYCRFDGSMIHTSGNTAELNRGGWNWFMPSPSALARMMR